MFMYLAIHQPTYIFMYLRNARTYEPYSALGYVLGAEIAQLFGSWRWALRMSSPFGLLLAILILFFTTDPPRGLSDGVQQFKLPAKLSGFRGAYEDWLAVCRIKTWAWVTFSYTAITFVAGALAQWAPTYMYRQSLATASPYVLRITSQYVTYLSVR